MESILVPVACLLLLIGFIAVILQPILTTNHAWLRPTNLARTRLELTEQKEQLYSSIRELEFDHSLGKISDADLESLKHDLETQALTTLRQLDDLEGSSSDADSELDARIEADVSSIQTSAASAPPAPTNFCPACGTARNPAHKFCPACGGAFDDVSVA